jgi:hypothetical protein
MSRHFCFTINNPACQPSWTPKVTYAVWQLEKGAEGTPHYQGYLQYESKTTIAKIQKILGGKAHVEIAKGTPAQARAYASKADTRAEGPWSHGQCNDAVGVVTSAKPKLKRKREEEIKDKEVVIYCGPPGTGKSYDARNYLGDNFHNWPAKSAASNTRWCGECDPESNLLIDEWQSSDFAINELAAIFDTYPATVPAAAGGKCAVLRAKRVALTTNMTLEQVQRFLEKHPKIKRRVHIIRHNVHVHPSVRENLNGPKVETQIAPQAPITKPQEKEKVIPVVPSLSIN